MKLNKKLYNTITGEPKEVQNLENGKIVNVYSMNSHPYLDYYTLQKREFAVFSTLDGNTYKLLIEDGYYENLHDLYDCKINGIWEEYVTTAHKARNNFVLKVTTPILFAYLILAVIVLVLTSSNIFAFLGLLLVLFIINGVLKNQQIMGINKITVNSTNKIKEAVGALRFEELLKIQDEYVKKYLGVGENETEKEVDEIDDSFEEEKPTIEEEANEERGQQNE